MARRDMRCAIKVTTCSSSSARVLLANDWGVMRQTAPCGSRLFAVSRCARWFARGQSMLEPTPRDLRQSARLLLDQTRKAAYRANAHRAGQQLDEALRCRLLPSQPLSERLVLDAVLV